MDKKLNENDNKRIKKLGNQDLVITGGEAPKHHKHEWAMDVPKYFGIDGFENCLGFVGHTHPTKRSGGVSICPYMSADVGVANHLNFH